MDEKEIPPGSTYKIVQGMDDNALEGVDGMLSEERIAESGLLRRVAEGKATALEEFYSRYFSRVYRYAYYRVGSDHQHAEEVVNDTFMEALEKADSYDPERGSVDSWLITISRNRIRSNNAKMGRPHEYEQSWSAIDGELDALFADPDSDNLPAAALEKEDLPVRDMAKLLEKTEKSIESQLMRARAAFREIFLEMASGAAPAG